MGITKMSERDWTAEEVDRRIMEKEDLEAYIRDNLLGIIREDAIHICNECHETEDHTPTDCSKCTVVRED